MDLQLSHRKAFISGSTKGIGFGIARRLLQEGAEVIINGRSRAGVDEAVHKLQSLAPGRVSGIPADFSRAREVDDLIGRLPDLDILVNNVGIFGPVPFGKITDEEWFRIFEVNVMSGVRLCRHVFPGMLARHEGRILFISSESAVFIPKEMIHYGMTKTALLAVSRGLAELSAGTGVTVNTILPGPTESEGTIGFMKDLAASEGIDLSEARKEFFRNKRPTSLLQRHASVDEVAATVAYFASPLASATNGAAIRAEGGIIRSVL